MTPVTPGVSSKKMKIIQLRQERSYVMHKVGLPWFKHPLRFVIVNRSAQNVVVWSKAIHAYGDFVETKDWFFII